MFELKERYIFDWIRIGSKDGYHIEYCITDICNRNCAACSHLAPLAKAPNFVSVEEFTRVTAMLRQALPEIHTFWLTGGEPTLHPQYMELLKIARQIYTDCYIGIYTNGSTLKNKETDAAFWEFVRERGIVWGVTLYGEEREYFESLFSRHGCLKNLAIVQGGRYFLNLTNYSKNQAITKEKYEQCGWERGKINVRNGKIYNCASSEFVDLFNGYFGAKLKISETDYLNIDETLTKERIDKFRNPIPFCGHCDLDKRYKRFFRNVPSERKMSEWSDFKPIEK